MTALSYQLGLSALATAIDMIKRGRTERGVDLLNHGLEFLRDRIMTRDTDREPARLVSKDEGQ